MTAGSQGLLTDDQRYILFGPTMSKVEAHRACVMFFVIWSPFMLALLTDGSLSQAFSLMSAYLAFAIVLGLLLGSDSSFFRYYLLANPLRAYNMWRLTYGRAVFSRHILRAVHQRLDLQACDRTFLRVDKHPIGSHFDGRPLSRQCVLDTARGRELLSMDLCDWQTDEVDTISAIKNYIKVLDLASLQSDRRQHIAADERLIDAPEVGLSGRFHIKNRITSGLAVDTEEYELLQAMRRQLGCDGVSWGIYGGLHQQVIPASSPFNLYVLFEDKASAIHCENGSLMAIWVSIEKAFQECRLFPSEAAAGHAAGFAQYSFPDQPRFQKSFPVEIAGFMQLESYLDKTSIWAVQIDPFTEPDLQDSPLPDQ